ncbi:MAG: iron ABC transporter permease [Bacillota bacterium]|nr:iron ABC transporter permease [Bacillota bacterium]
MRAITEADRKTSAVRLANPFMLSFIMVIFILLALSIGRYPVSVHQIMLLFKGHFMETSATIPAVVEQVIFDIRLPRILTSLIIGAALSVSGAAYQGIFRNPLVSPDILGVSAGAGLGATIGIVFSWSSLGIAFLAFGFGVLAVLLTYLIGSKIKNMGDTSLVLVLSGLLIGTVFSSLVSLIKCVADPYDKLPAITYWLMGSLASITFDDVYLIIIPVIVGIIPIWVFRWKMNVLVFGDEEAHSMGINAGRLRAIVIVSATLLTASAVSVSGMIGWVGLVIPHLARSLVGPNYQKLLPVSLLLGSSFLLLVDTLARSLMPMEIPLGILTSLIGAPFFVFLLTNSRRTWK